MLYFDEKRYNYFLNLVVFTQKKKYNANNFFRKSEIYYKSQDEINVAENKINVVEILKK